MAATAKIAKSTKTIANKKQPRSFWEELFAALEDDSQPTATKATGKPRMTVSSSYRLEDRYVSYKVMLPDYLGNQEGKVIVNIVLRNVFGTVIKIEIII